MAPPPPTSPTHPASPRRSPGPRARRAARAPLAGVAATALVVPLALVATAPLSSAAPAGAAFGTSFEQGDSPEVLVSTPELQDGEPLQDGVAGGEPGLPGSLRDDVVAVTASADNPPNEVAAAGVDGSTSSKWLTFSPTGWLQVELAEARPVTTWSMTSADDEPARDPRSVRLLGSDDGQSWTEVDRRTDVTFPARLSTQQFVLDEASAPHRWYRLQVDANGGAPLLQLAELDLADGTAPVDGTAEPMTTEVGPGPASGPTIRPRVGFTGVAALRYAGVHTADGRGYAVNRVLDVDDVAVGEDSRLSYRVFPELTGGDLSYPSLHVAMDVRFTDGTRLSELGATDQHGYPLTAAGQGASDVLYPDQWNQVEADLGAVAAGKTVEALLLSYDDPDADEGTAFGGWVDDVVIDPSPERLTAPADGTGFAELVDTRRGTNSTGSFSRGNNLPITAVPNGFNFLTPTTNANSQSWEYDWARGNDARNRPHLQGLAFSHEPSPWMGDRNQVSFMPATADGVPAGGAQARSLPFAHDDETAQPDYYGVDLDGGLRAEMTPTDHGAVMRFSFPEGAPRQVVVDTVDDDGEFSVAAGSDELTGWVDNGSGLSAGRSRMFVAGTFDRAASAAGETDGGHAGTRYAAFDGDGDVELRVATSFISLDQARANLAMEVAGRSFDDVRADAARQWDERLGVVEVQGASETELRSLYGSLYRLNLYPNSQFENTGTADEPVYRHASPMAEPAGEPTATETGAEVVDGKIYVNNGFWDTYRTVWPAYSLLYPDVAAELVDGFVQHYRDGGWVSRWSSPGYANLMTGTSSDVAFADAYLKGVDLPDALETYDAAVKNATTPSDDAAVGRKGLDSSIFLGYTPTTTGESVSWGLEGFINDYGIGNMAAALAEDPRTPEDRRARLREESTYFLDRATGYSRMFDPSVGFFQGREPDGEFQQSPEEFDPEAWGGVYTETDGWNFAFHAPHDGAGLAALYGGRQGLEDKLDEFFATPEEADKPGGYGGVIHEMREARDVRLGQLGMSNQVSHHIPYAYLQADAPEKTQALVRDIMRRLYTGDEIGQGYPGDEDNGEMSAWYVLSSLGIYPQQVGSDRWSIGSPLFDRAVVHRPDGDLVVEAQDAGGGDNGHEDVYVQSLAVDGQEHEQTWLTADQVSGGHELDFTTGPEPSSWGSATEDSPPSLTPEGEAPDPLEDSTAEGLGRLTSADGGDVGALVDDTSRTEAVLGADATLTWDSAVGARAVRTYTLTSGSGGTDGAGDPSAWVLEGSDDGESWTQVDARSGQTFDWRRQTRPFQVDDARSSVQPYSRYRLRVTDGTQEQVSLSEVELLVDPAEAVTGDLAVTAGQDLTAQTGTEVSGDLAVVAGADADAVDVTVDWGDGSEPAPADVREGRLGSLVVSGGHTYAEPGVHRVVVTATAGDESASAALLVDVALVPEGSLRAAFDSTCLGDEGTAVGATADCDAKGWAYSRAALADAGLVQGERHEVPGTDLSFVLPAVPAGAPDNATGDGQVVDLDLPADATQVSFVGAGTQGAQDETATLTYADGSTQEVPLQLSDWTLGGGAGDPQFGNVVVAAAQYRLRDGSRDGARPYVFATAPVALDGPLPVSVTMPDQQGTETEDGRVHVMAVASDGTPAAALELSAPASVAAVAGQPVEAALGTVSGGTAAPEDVTARVLWGDGTPLEEVATRVEDDAATVAGDHVYAQPGSYTAHVTVDDGRSSVTREVRVEVSAAPAVEVDPALGLGARLASPGARVAVTGTGFAPGEQVEMTLQRHQGRGEAEVVALATVRADADGGFSTQVRVPADARRGPHDLRAHGVTSDAATSERLVVAGR
ncbi:GH92 family glycosyl hydrolase [Pseudokineococcus basanitobsidens]|uniref:GH92 family glycosyl hydrolase n=1 Tax=Pseudokineococcus basanitobsidens TaxID=1926649 RepID=A0ABU8RIU0_9ACTN